MISARGLTKTYGAGSSAVRVLKEVEFDVAAGTVFTLLGPSGSGKTTTLRCIAGLEQPDLGEIRLGDRVVFSSDKGIHVGPERRRLGMVFQSYAIWPHMTVGQNVAYPLEGCNLARSDIAARVSRALEQVGLPHLIDRPAPDLSGGQQQRVALARALVAEPEVLLLDEPLSNLDAKLREQMRREIVHLQRRLGVTTLFVTHDQEEALALSDTIALMNESRVVEMGTPMTLYDFPLHRFTAEFLGLANFVPGSPVDGNEDTVVMDTPFGRFEAIRRAENAAVREFFFRPHHARLCTEGSEALNIGRGTVVESTFLGETTDVLVEKGGQTVRLRLHAADRPKPSEEISFVVDPRFSLGFGAA